MKKMSAKKLCISALMTALVCVSTAVIQVPIPLGYMHLGNVMILAAGVFFGPTVGLLAGGIGSALADLLTGFAMWAVPTLIIKSLMGYVIGRLAWKAEVSLAANLKKEGLKARQFRLFLANAAGIAIMVAGYTFFGAIIYGSVPAGLSQIPGLTTEGIIAVIIFYAVYAAMSAAHVVRWIVRAAE